MESPKIKYRYEGLSLAIYSSTKSNENLGIPSLVHFNQFEAIIMD